MNMTDKIKGTLKWAGSFMAIAGAFAYLIITIIIVMGIENSIDANSKLLFAILSAVSGLLISISLILQGIQISKEENKESLDEYHSFFYKAKKKFRFTDQMWWYLLVKITENVLFKALSIAASTWLVFDIVTAGNGDISLIFSAIANIVMFLGFGLMGLSSAYTHHDGKYMTLIREKTERLKIETMTSPSIEKQTKILKNETMTPPSVEEQGENNELQLQREEVPITSGTSWSEQERD